MHSVSCFKAAWSCYFKNAVKTNSAQKRTLAKDYEYRQTFNK